MDNYNTKIHQQEKEEAEETLSLRNLPVNSNIQPENEGLLNPQKRPPDEESDAFEFFSDVSSEMSHAEDIFFRGKILPLQEKALSNHCRRFEPLSQSSAKMIDRSSSSMSTTRFKRNCRSLDHKKSSSLRFQVPNVPRALSDKSSEKSDASGTVKSVSKPRWYKIMFGHVKFPQEMDLQDIKNRQIRSKPNCLKAPVVNQSARKNLSSWDLLGMLSCNNYASVAVTASISSVQRNCRSYITRHIN